jgi:hypothetical protein
VQRDWEAKRVATLVGGKNYYSIAPDYRTFFEFLRDVAGNPAPGTTGITLPPFDEEWLKVWGEMVAVKIRTWKKASKVAQDIEIGSVKAKL